MALFVLLTQERISRANATQGQALCERLVPESSAAVADGLSSFIRVTAFDTVGRDGPLGRGGSSLAGRKAMPAGGSSAPGFGRRHPAFRRGDPALRIADPGLRLGNSALRRADPAFRIDLPAFGISSPTGGDGAAARENDLLKVRRASAYLFMATLVMRLLPSGHPAGAD